MKENKKNQPAQNDPLEKVEIDRNENTSVLDKRKSVNDKKSDPSAERQQRELDKDQQKIKFPASKKYEIPDDRTSNRNNEKDQDGPRNKSDVERYGKNPIPGEKNKNQPVRDERELEENEEQESNENEYETSITDQKRHRHLNVNNDKDELFI